MALLICFPWRIVLLFLLFLYYFLAILALLIFLHLRRTVFSGRAFHPRAWRCRITSPERTVLWSTAIYNYLLAKLVKSKRAQSLPCASV